MAEQILPKGVCMFNKNDKAPDFVIVSMVITMNDLFTFCKDNPGLLTEYNGQKQLRLQVLKSKEGNMYCAVDTYKKDDTAPATSTYVKPPEVAPVDDLPF